MDFLSVWKTFTQPNKIVKQSVYVRLSLLSVQSVQRGKNQKTDQNRDVEKRGEEGGGPCQRAGE